MHIQISKCNIFVRIGIFPIIANQGQDLQSSAIVEDSFIQTISLDDAFSDINWKIMGLFYV